MAANVTLPDELLERAKARATDEGKSVDDLAAEALADFLRSGTLRRSEAKLSGEAEANPRIR